MTLLERQAAKNIVQTVKDVLSGKTTRAACGAISVEMFCGELTLSREAAVALLRQIER